MDGEMGEQRCSIALTQGVRGWILERSHMLGAFCFLFKLTTTCNRRASPGLDVEMETQKPQKGPETGVNEGGEAQMCVLETRNFSFFLFIHRKR